METPVRWGVLGCGSRVFARRMASAFARAEGNELVAVASRDGEKARAVATALGVPRAYGDYDALLADGEVDAVYLPLPNDLHHEWTLRALQAGKHVLCDKPAALSYADAHAMANAARDAGLRLQEGFMYRHHPQHERLAEIIASGEIGPVRHIRGAFTYRVDPAQRSGIRWNPAQGGGALLDVGVYPVNAARRYFASEPAAVYAASHWDAATGVDVQTTALLEFADGRTAIAIGAFDQAFTTRLEVVGEAGSVLLERAFQIGEAGVTLAVRVGDAPARVETLPHTDAYVREIEDFGACVRDPGRPLAPGENGAAQARVVEALQRSARERRRVEVAEV